MTFAEKKVINVKGKKKKEKKNQPSESKGENPLLPAVAVPVTCFQRRIMPNISIVDIQNDNVH